MHIRHALAVGVLVAMMAPAGTAAGAPPPHYRLVDVGTFGGPNAEVNGPAQQVTPRGAVLGNADTVVPNTDFPHDGLCAEHDVLTHAFSYQHGRLTDLGALPGDNCSVVFELNRSGLGVGASETGAVDRRLHLPSFHPVVFRNGKVMDIGTLPGGSEGFAISVNDRGQVLGLSNAAPGGPGYPEFFDWDGSIHSFVWQHGVKRDLGSLGGPGTLAATMNERGQVAGDSYVDGTVNPATGFPTQHAFLWQDGRMRDLGSLGGARVFTWWMNRHGQVVGWATLAGEAATHPFLWDGHRLRDLGTLGGSYAEADRVNDHGVVVGGSVTSDGSYHTYVWRAGATTDLSPDECTFPEWINNRDEIVGARCGESAALLWQHGREYDLDDLVGPTDIHLTTATYVDDRGRIVALGVLPNGNRHVFLLRPTRRST